MKVVFTGAGGGHFYPLIAVAERIRKEAFAQNLSQPEFYFFSDKPYDEESLFSVECKFVPILAGKLRVYPSAQTFFDILKTFFGCISAIGKLYSVYPDVVFAKGGYASFPTLFAARILSIPVIVHESDTVPGRVTLWAGKFAYRVAVSYPQVANLYPKEVTALTGQPIRDALLPPENFSRVYEKKERPVLLILGGSQGSQVLNTAILSLLPELLMKYDIVHQAGGENIESIKKLSEELLASHPNKDRYFVEGFIDTALFYPKVDLVITRAGSAMFEMALWQLPSIAVPIPETISRDQRTNAYTMASYGCVEVIEENNLSNAILSSAISRILDNEEIYTKMSRSCQAFDTSYTAATTIAREIIRIGLSHSN